MERTDRLPQLIARRWPVERWQELTVLVGVSGGPDSVALLSALHELVVPRGSPGGPLRAAHFNHRWRSDADDDEQYVRQLCQRLDIPLTVGRARRDATGPSPSEAKGRKQRYRFLRHTAHRLGARYVALGHTWDDQVETVLFRVIRGCGLRGLQGIPRIRRLSQAVTLIRPQLEVRRAEILAYLAERHQDYRQDATNSQLQFRRNRIRHELLPLLEQQYHPGTRAALARLAQLARQADRQLAREIRRQLQRSVRCRSADHVEFEFFSDQTRLVRTEIIRLAWRRQRWPLRAMTRRHWLILAREPRLQPQRLTMPGGICATWSAPHRLTLTRDAPR